MQRSGELHTNLAHASVPDMRRMLMAARAPQAVLDALARFSCAQCDAMSVPQTDTDPFFETETSEVLLRQYRQWTRAYGRPRWLKIDASRTNLGETLQRALEADGNQLLDVPGEAHEKVGRVEVQMHPPDHGSQEFYQKKVRLQPFPDSHWS